jgi:hypothetical protein
MLDGSGTRISLQPNLLPFRYIDGHELLLRRPLWKLTLSPPLR